MEQIVAKMCHAPADCFRVRERGFIREGYFADLVIVDPDEEWTINKENIFYKCGWSPLEGKTFKGNVKSTFVNGQIVYKNGEVLPFSAGKRMQFH